MRRRLIALTLLLAGSVHAGGPYPAITGISAAADDAAVAGTNPAAMTLFDETVRRIDVYGFFSDNTWEGQLGEDGPTFVSEDTSSTVVPQGSMVMPFRENWWFGFTVLGSGFSEDYDDDWPGRYYLQEYDLVYISAFPSIATKLTDRLSVAASLAMTYTQYDQRKAVPNVDPGFDDGTLVVETDGLSAGLGLSFLYEFSDRTRVGFNYRSEIEPSLDGTAQFSGLGPITEEILDEAGLLGARVDVTSRQPQSITLGIYHDFANGHTVTADVAWSEFSEFVLAEIYVEGDQIVSNEQEFEDILAFAASYSWPVADRWRLGIGGFVANEAIDDSNRTMTLRLDDLWSLGAGFEWQWKEDRAVTFTLNYLKIDDAPVETPELPVFGAATGRFTDRGTIYFRAGLSFGPTRG